MPSVSPTMPTQKKSPERYVAMDRRQELVAHTRATQPQAKDYTDEEIIEQKITQQPEYAEYFKLPQDDQEIIQAIRRDYPEAVDYTDDEIMQLRSSQGKQSPNTAVR